jgi:hypothetical protein
MKTIDADAVWSAFRPEAKIGVGSSTATMEVHTLGKLEVPTGLIIACDPFLGFDGASAFAESAPVGAFPVVVAVAAIEHVSKKSKKRTLDRRVAYALLRFSTRKPVRLVMALKKGQSLSKLGKDEIYGYGVDAGAGCFVDARIAAQLVKQDKTNATPDDDMLPSATTLMDLFYGKGRSNIATWAHGILHVEGSSDNLVAFSSGWGDGFYASYWGFDGDGEVAFLMTDFDVIV